MNLKSTLALILGLAFLSSVPTAADQAVGNGGGISKVTAGSNIVVTNGTTQPQVAVTAAPSFSALTSAGASFTGGITLNGTGNRFSGSDFYFGSADNTTGNIHFRTNGYNNADTASIAAANGNFWTNGTVTGSGFTVNGNNCVGWANGQSICDDGSGSHGLNYWAATGSTLGHRFFSGTAAGATEMMDLSPGSVAGAETIKWYTDESTYDYWAWYVNGSGNGAGVGTHTLQLWYYPNDTTNSCCMSVFKVVPDVSSGHPNLNSSAGYFELVPSLHADGNVSIAGTLNISGGAGGNTVVLPANSNIIGGSGQIGFQTSSVSVQSINCNVGIAYAAHNWTDCFDTSGNLGAGGYVASTGYRANEGTPNSAVGFSFNGDGGEDTGMFSTADGDLRFYSNNNEIMENSGNDVAVNNSLHLGGSTACYQAGDICVQRSSAATTGVIYLGSTANHYLYFDGTNYQLPNGAVYATAFVNNSKRSLKHDIHSIKGLDAINLLKNTCWASFRYKAGPQDTHYGFVADCTPSILSGPNKDHFDAETTSTIDALAILQQQDEIATLQARVHQLEQQVALRKPDAPKHSIYWYIFHPWVPVN